MTLRFRHLRPRQAVIALLACLASLGAAAPAAWADKADQLLLEACRTGTVSGKYSQSDYRKAISRIPADSDQYTDCRDVLRRAQLAAASGRDPGSGGGAGAGGGGGGPAIDPATGIRADPLTSATDEERAEVASVAKGRGAGFALAGKPIKPGEPGSLAGSTMPPNLIVFVALVALLALGSAGWTITSRVRARRPTT